MADLYAPCRSCKQMNLHTVVCQDIEKFGNADDFEPYELQDSRHWQVIRCLGCQTRSFRKYQTDFWSGDPDGPEISDVEFFPQSGIGKHELRNFHHLPKEIARVYQEVVQAYNAGLYTLATMGVRMVIEGIAKASGIEVRGISKKIEALQEKGLLTLPHALILHELREHGNDAAHDLTRPAPEQLKQIIKILETTLEVFYEFEGQQRLMKLQREHRESQKNSSV